MTKSFKEQFDKQYRTPKTINLLKIDLVRTFVT